MNNYITPKARFLDSADRIKTHRQIVDNAAVRESLNTALLQMQVTLQFSKLPPADAFQQLSGGLLFMQIWLNLSEKGEPTVSPPNDNLNHKV